MQNVQVMLDKLPWQTADQKRLNTTIIDRSAIELRTDELLTVSIGGELDNVEELSNIKFPEPIKLSK
jgi:hypothetical protein